MAWENPDYPQDDSDIDDELDRKVKSREISIRMADIERFCVDGTLRNAVLLEIEDEDDEFLPPGTRIEEIEEILSRYSVEVISDMIVRFATEQEIDNQRVQTISSLRGTLEHAQRYGTLETDDLSKDLSATLAEGIMKDFLENNQFPLHKIRRNPSVEKDEFSYATFQERFLEYIEEDLRAGDVISVPHTIIRHLLESAIPTPLRMQFAEHIILPTLEGSYDQEILEDCLEFLEHYGGEKLWLQGVRSLLYSSSTSTIARCLPFIRNLRESTDRGLSRGDVGRIDSIIASIDEADALNFPND